MPSRRKVWKSNLSHLPRPPREAVLRRIDDDHANPRKLWEVEGAPEYPHNPLMEKLHAASMVREETQPFTVSDDITTLTLTLPPQGVAAVTLRF